MVKHKEFYEYIMSQIRSYLDGSITKEEFYNTCEPYYTKHAVSYHNQSFHDYFIDIVADACLVYIDEPGLSPDENERLFHETLKAAYVELQKPQYF